MKRNTSSKLLVILCVLALVSCKSKKKLMATLPPTAETTVTSPAPVTATNPPPATAPIVKPNPVPVNAIKAAQLTFNTFSGKASGKMDLNGDKNDVTLNIRIAKDKKIWVSVTVSLVVTVEVARAVITPDSLLAIDKVHGLYVKKPFNYIYQYTNKQIDYKMLEALFTGNVPPVILKDGNASYQSEANGSIVSGVLEDLVYKLMLNQDTKPGQLNISNHNAGQSLQVTNNDFTMVSGKKVPSQIDIQSAAGGKNVHVNLKYTKIDLDQPLDYPFNIPEKYKPADEN